MSIAGSGLVDGLFHIQLPTIKTKHHINGLPTEWSVEDKTEVGLHCSAAILFA